MATASMEKPRAEQPVNRTASSTVPLESSCTRCGGLMVDDFCMDVLGNIGEAEFAAKRCVQCGEVVDPVILRNRGTRHELILASPAHVRSTSSASQGMVQS